MQQHIRGSFVLLGSGAFVLALVLFGRVSADATTTSATWQTIFWILGGLGILSIVAGLARFLWTVYKLHQGGTHG